MVWFGLYLSSKVYTMEEDRREKSVEQSTNAISNPSARSENTFFVNCPVAHKKGINVVVRFLYLEIS